jgi:DNA polymerase-4
MILLVDMDAFFASVEQAHHPHLRGQPVIVCGDPSRRGVVTAASYEARPSGVRAGMPLQEARRLCPHAHYVEGDPEKYVAISLALLHLYLSLTPDVEPFSVDEAFLSIGRATDTPATVREVAADLQQRIRDRFGLSASIGIGPNKLVAKMAAGVEKPSGLTALDEAGFRDVFWPQGVQEMWGIGPKLAERMRSLGIATIADLAHAPDLALQAAFGIIGPQLKQAAWGRDETPFTPYHQGVDAKSMGHEVTLPEDCDDPGVSRGHAIATFRSGLAPPAHRRLRRPDGVREAARPALHHADPPAGAPRLHRRIAAGIRDCAGPVAGILAGWSVAAGRRHGLTARAPQLARTDRVVRQDDRAVRLRETLDRVRDKLGEASLVPAGSLTYRRRLSHVPFGAVRNLDRERNA